MKSLEFTAFGLPKGQPRARACVRGRHAAMYDPGTADDWKWSVRAAAVCACGKKWSPFDSPVRASMEFLMPRPQSHYQTKKGVRTVRELAPEWHTAKPDVDNLAKAVMDALTTANIWPDDKLVCSIKICKRYAETPGCLVKITELLEV